MLLVVWSKCFYRRWTCVIISTQCSAVAPPISVVLVVLSVSYPFFLTNQLLLDCSLDISCPPEMEHSIFSVCGCRCITVVMWTESSGLRLTGEAIGVVGCCCHSCLHFIMTGILNQMKASGTHSTGGMKVDLDMIRGNTLYDRKKEFHWACLLHHSSACLELTLHWTKGFKLVFFDLY